MSNEETLQDLIQQLKSLQLQVQQVVTKIEEVITEGRGPNTTSVTTTATAASRHRHLIPASHVFKKGDRVRINNKIKLPKSAGRTVTEADRLAIVTEVSGERGERVDIRTDNGTKTWRHAKNLSFHSTLVFEL